MKMSVLKLLLPVVLLSLFFSNSAALQDSRPGVENIQYFYRVSRLPTIYPDSTLLRFDLSIPFEKLIFVAKDSSYVAGIKFTLFITDKDHNTVFEKSRAHNIEVDTYEETQIDTAFYQFSMSTNVSPAEYIVIIEAVDININISQFKEFKIKIQDYTGKKIVVGDLLLFDGIHDFSKEDFNNLTPSPTNICRDNFTLFSKIYLPDSDSDINIQIKWFDNNRKILTDTAKTFQNGRFLSLYKSYSIKEIQQGLFEVELSITGKNFKAKASDLEIEVIKQIAHFKEESLDRAIEQMIYIGEGALWDSLKNAETLEQKKNWFSQFWQQYYTASESKSNPVQEEYFRRVRYSNRRFDEGLRGWRCDRGRIYIIYGRPDEIQKSTDNMMRQLEIWIYQSLEKQFIFLDANGIGSFRLLRGY